MKEQLLKTSGADVSSSRKKLRKTLGGVGIPPLVRPRVNSTTIMLSQSLIHYIINYKLEVPSDDIFETDSMNYRFSTNLYYIGTKMSISGLQMRRLFRTVLWLRQALFRVSSVFKWKTPAILTWTISLSVSRSSDCCVDAADLKRSKVLIVCLTKYVKSICMNVLSARSIINQTSELVRKFV